MNKKTIFDIGDRMIFAMLNGVGGWFTTRGKPSDQVCTALAFN
ncbi:MAG: hypothetical protein VCB59_00240 [Gammaproteobacteria bacterium]